MFITGLGTAAPTHRYTQAQCWDALQNSSRFQELAPRSRAILKKVLTGANGIATRHLALENLNDAFALTPDALHARFTKNAPLLASQAAERAFADAKMSPREVDAVVASTCTGYLCPGLTSYIGERLGLRKDVMTFDLVGQGCAGALPNWQLASALLDSGRCAHVLSICVEVSSAAMYLDDDPGVLISACLFGDGAGAAILSRDTTPHGRSVRWTQAVSLTRPEERDALRFEHRGGLLRNVLTRAVPRLAAEYAAEVFSTALRRAGLLQQNVNGWIMHAGGRDVLSAIEGRLCLDTSALGYSRAILSEFGNLSSAFVYFVLEAALNDRAPGGWWWMSSFGAGFSCHGALLAVE